MGEKSQKQVVPAEVIYLVAESFMLNDYPSKGVVTTFQVGHEVKDAKIIAQHGSFLRRSLREVTGESAGDILDAVADEKIEKLEDANVELRDTVKRLEKANAELTKENEWLTAELEKTNKEIEKLKKR